MYRALINFRKGSKGVLPFHKVYWRTECIYNIETCPMRCFFCLIFVLSNYLFVFAQDNRLTAKFSFDNCEAVNDLDVEDNAIVFGPPECDCGAIGNSYRFENINDELAIVGQQILSDINRDFTLSFYMKPTNLVGSQPREIISKRVNCSVQNAFLIDYTPFNRTVNVLLSEREDKQVLLEGTLPLDLCWFLITVVRQNTDVFLYINGQLQDEGRTSTRANIENSSPLNIGSVTCPMTHGDFRGFLDEIEFYSRAFSELDVRDLYNNPPDQIITPDALIILGDSVNVEVGKTCASNFSWSPQEGVFQPLSSSTIIQPPVSGDLIYEVTFDDGICRAKDDMLIRVVDPGELNCDEVFLPSAFTPNGDGLNDSFGISNPFVIEALESFNIYDRWGTLMFSTNNKEDRWDGTFKGVAINSGMYFYQVRYSCQGKDLVKSDGVNIVR